MNLIIIIKMLPVAFLVSRLVFIFFCQSLVPVIGKIFKALNEGFVY